MHAAEAAAGDPLVAGPHEFPALGARSDLRVVRLRRLAVVHVQRALRRRARGGRDVGGRGTHLAVRVRRRIALDVAIDDGAGIVIGVVAVVVRPAPIRRAPQNRYAEIEADSAAVPVVPGAVPVPGTAPVASAAGPVMGD